MHATFMLYSERMHDDDDDDEKQDLTALIATLSGKFK